MSTVLQFKLKGPIYSRQSNVLSRNGKVQTQAEKLHYIVG